jgi:DNA-binding response OmpR family regulator
VSAVSQDAEAGSDTFRLGLTCSAILIGDANQRLVEAALAGCRVSLIVHDRLENAARDPRFTSADLLISGPASSRVRPCAACWGARARGFKGFVFVVQDESSAEFPEDPARAWADDFVTLEADPARSVAAVRQHVQLALGGSVNSLARPSRWWPHIQLGALSIDCETQLIAFEGAPANLTPTQFALIAYVVYNGRTMGGLISNQELSRQVFGTTTDAYLAQRQFRFALRRLSSKARDVFERIHGFGVRLSPLVGSPLMKVQ